MKGRVKIILRFARPYKATFLLLFLCIIVTTFSGAVYPYIFGRLVDEVFYGKNMSVFLNIVLIYGTVYLFNQLMHFALNMSWASLMTKFLYDIRAAIFNKALSFKGERLAGVYSGDIIERMSKDTEQFMSYIHWNVFYTAGTALNLCLSLAFIAYLNPRMAIFTVLLTPVVVYTSRYFAKRVKKLYEGIAKQRGRLSSWLFEIIKGMQEVRLLNAGRYAVSDYIGKTVKIMRLKVEAGRVELTSERVNTGITLLSRLILYVACAFFIAGGSLTLGGFTACVSYFGTCIAGFASLNGKSIAIAQNMVSIDRVIEVLHGESEDINENAPDIDIREGGIHFKNVSFSYAGTERKVLDGVELQINAGERLSLVGYSGAGKTTMANLIVRLYDINDGSISIDGTDIRDFNLRALRAQIGIVHQESILFEGTVRFNISWSNDPANDSKIWHALGRAGLEDFIRSLPRGLDTVISAGGASFSGGQKQRLAIARVFAKDPKILIFDEATSSLDAESESIVRASWEDMCRGRTIIVIAHRLSTILNSDRIAVLKDGRIDGCGAHARLLEESSHYTALFREQYSGEEAVNDAKSIV